MFINYSLFTSKVGKKKITLNNYFTIKKLILYEKSENWPGENVLFIDVQYCCYF